ncbi:ER membrane protein complex subunit 7 homolog [Bolinopsis microptera]|uniref:ER membrane protein complex subunit 7 homolog n=1 Tax=Bolinopsis microptera TaxID=2820187 RepID=UPI003078C113
MFWSVLFGFIAIWYDVILASESAYDIRGQIAISNDPGWQTRTLISANFGEYHGYAQQNGSFVIPNVKPGSYIVEVLNPNYIIAPVRVEISSKASGRIRARKVDYVQPNEVMLVKYPLTFRVADRTNFFEKRETWHITDVFSSPMVPMLLLPVFFMLVLPKIKDMQDPETKKELEDASKMMSNPQMPDMSDMLTSLLGGTKKPKKIASSKIRR